MQNIEKNLQQVEDQISQSAQQFGRDATSIKLLAVSKTKPAESIRQLATLGQKDFGESYLQEAEQKIHELADLPITWHFIGPIQSNKTRKISELFDWVHSVDRLKIAQRLNQHRAEQEQPLSILLQVNIENEASKSGIPPDQLLTLAQQIKPLSHLQLRGLMVIPAPQPDFNAQRKICHQAFQLFTQLKQIEPRCDTLSMGMSNDMQAAIAEGSTLVRIGTAIFGKRQ